MRVGIDFDSTIAKIDAPWLGRLNALCHTNYKPEDWTDWDLSFLPEKERKILFDVFTPDLYDIVKPYPDAPAAITDLARMQGVELVCVSANPSKHSEAFTLAKKKWLKQYFPDLADSPIFSKNKCGLGLDILVDDAPHHFETPDFIPVLVERPWNRFVACELRFQDWNEGRKLLFSLIKSQKHRHGRAKSQKVPVGHNQQPEKINS